MPKLSCCLIVRDAETTLEACLKSVRPHVDELVVVDTGSEDDTCKIAMRYADTLIGFPWCDDFSAARNHAMDACTGDWIIWLDADDELIGGETLRPLIASTPDAIGMYLIRYVTARNPAGNALHEFWRERLVRRDAVRWQGRAHEVLYAEPVPPHVRFEGAYVEHRRTGGGEQSMRRNIRLLELDLADDPTNTRTLFYLGRDLITLGERDRGQELLERYLELSVWPDEQFIATQLVAICHRMAGRHEDAFGVDMSALLLHPDWPQAWYALAQDCYHLGRWAWSSLFCEIGQRCPPPQTNLFVSPAELEHGWMIYQVCALDNLGRHDEAVALTMRALRLDPTNQHHRYNAQYFVNRLLATAPSGGG